MELLPLVEDEEWFFDTELLVTAQRIGLRIHEVPVDWVDDTDSRVEILHTALMDLRGMWRLMGPTARRRAVRRPVGPDQDIHPWGTGDTSDRVPIDLGDRWGDRVTELAPGAPSGRQGTTSPHDIHDIHDTDDIHDTPGTAVFADELLRFAGVGAVSTAAYAALFAVLEPGLGSYPANAVAIALCSLGNTAAHRGMAGTAHHGLDRRHRMVTAATLMGVSLAFTTGALAVTRAAGLTSLLPELVAVSVANVGAAVIRFGILRTWVFRPEFGTNLTPRPTTPIVGAQQQQPMELTRTPS
jgi:putative flippase GtrA